MSYLEKLLIQYQNLIKNIKMYKLKDNLQQ